MTDAPSSAPPPASAAPVSPALVARARASEQGHVVREVAPRRGLLRGAAAPQGRLSLRLNVSWTFAGNVVYAACQWGVLMVLARLGSPELVGQYALGLAIAAPVFLLANLQLRSLQAIDVEAEHAFADYLGLRVATTLAAVLVVLGILGAAGYAAATAWVAVCITLAKAVEAFSDVMYGQLQQHERMDRVARSYLLRGPLMLAVIGGVLYASGDLVLAVAAAAVGSLLVLMLHDAPVTARHVSSLRPRWNARVARRIAWVALPLGIVTMLMALNVNVPRYFLQATLGERGVGFYSALVYLVVPLSTVVNALGQATSPALARRWVDGDRAAYRALLVKMLLVAAGLGGAGIAGALLLGEWALGLAYGSEYAFLAPLLVIVMVAALVEIVASVLCYAMTSMRLFRQQLAMFVLVLAATLGCAAALVPPMGIAGGVAALLVGRVVFLLVAGAFVAPRLRPAASDGSAAHQR
ncbi:MAG: lipopolysaccharide biosynthesis protein [Rubricoccaceae bacterium]